MLHRYSLLIISTIMIFSSLSGGNPDRRGQAGATELIINPWARSSGLHSLNVATVKGIEAMRLNMGGMAFTDRTEAIFAHTRWLAGSGISFNTIGLSQSVGASGVMGFDLMTVGFGEVQRTNYNNPEGGIGSYSPQFINLGFGYSYAFSRSIYGGLSARAVHESIADVSATGMALDAGIQYVTGPRDNIKFGIALRNVGTPMRYTGDGLSVKTTAPTGDYDMTMEHRSEDFEMPSQLNIGGAYDFNLHTDGRLTAVGNFTSNSFTQDQFGLGLEYAYMEQFMFRAAYKIERGLLQGIEPNLAYNGLAVGASIELPLRFGQQEPNEGEETEKKEKEENTAPRIALDYSYRVTRTFNGTHTAGLRIAL